MDGGGSGGRSQRGGHGGNRNHPYRKESSRQGPPPDEKVENKLYIGNLDHRVTEYHVLKLFSPFGKIKREEYLWHTHGPKRGEPRGYAFVEYSTRQDAERARAGMNGKTAFGRPLVVRFVDEKVVTYNQDAPVWTKDPQTSAPKVQSQAAVQSSISKSAKIAAIQSKLRAMEQEDKLRGAAQKPPSSMLSASSVHNVPLHLPGPPGGGSRGGDDQRPPHSRTLLQTGQRWSSQWG